MAQLQLAQNQVFNLKVTEFKSRNKKIPKSDGFKYDVYWVTVEDKSGNSVQCEFLAKEGTCTDCFQVGVYQYIRCGYISPKGTPEIEPAEEPGPVAQPVSGAAGIDADKISTNTYALPIAGRAIVFAMGFAKDILCAEIHQQPFGYRVTDEDIERMLSNADRISNQITERVTF